MELVLYSAGVLLAYATMWYGISLAAKRNDVADIAWGLGYVLLASIYLGGGEGSGRLALMSGLVIVWGLRLATHIFLRNIKKSEDPRYGKWRREWGKWFYVRSYLQVFVLQMVLLLMIISSVMIVADNAQPALTWVNYVGVVVWAIGFFFEVVGDYQLGQFIKNPDNKGEIMDQGLWRYTRHPNYFGEVTMWWGLYLIAFGTPYWWLAIVSPLTISILILFVSGIPSVEKRYAGNKAFEAYKKRTSIFIPLPPKQ